MGNGFNKVFKLLQQPIQLGNEPHLPLHQGDSHRAVIGNMTFVVLYDWFLVVYIIPLKENTVLLCFLFAGQDRKSTRLNSSHVKISYAVFCLKKKKNIIKTVHSN